MAISTGDNIVAGMQQPRPYMKTGITMAAAGGMRGYTPWYVAGIPGAGSAPTAGINGVAVVGPKAGQIARTNPVSGNAHLSSLSFRSSVAGVVWWIDRLWENSGLSVTSTAAQAITPATLPARDLNGTTNGSQVMAAIEWSVVGGAGTPTVSLTYTDDVGNTGNVGTVTAVTTPPVGTFEIFTFAAGDTGVRAPTSFIQSATRLSGTMHLVLFRLIKQMGVQANIGVDLDFIGMGGPRQYDGAVPQLVFFPGATTAGTFIGEYNETHG